MATLKQWIEEEANGEDVDGVVLGDMGWRDCGKEGVPNYDECPKEVVLSWEQAMPWLEYEFDDGYGAPGCQAVYAWTRTRVISVYQYDGSTYVYHLPRNPVSCNPVMVGG